VIRGSGVVNANGGLALTALSTITLTDTRTLNNAAMATWTGPGAFNIGGNAIVNNLVGATFAIQTAADMGAGTFNNQGTLTKQAGSGDGITAISSELFNTGVVEVLSGTLMFSNTYLQSAGVTRLNGGQLQSGQTLQIAGGTLEGAGVVTANVSNGGHVQPGLPLGQLSITGTYTQTAGGSLDVDIVSRPARNSTASRSPAPPRSTGRSISL